MATVRIATLKLHWKPSPSEDIQGLRVLVTVNGIETTFERDAQASDVTVEARAKADIQFRVIVHDKEGNEVSSVTFTDKVPDLEMPLPATGLGMTIVSVRTEEVPDEPPPEPGAAPRRAGSRSGKDS